MKLTIGRSGCTEKIMLLRRRFARVFPCRPLLIAAASVATTVLAAAPAWPPIVRPVSFESPPLSPAEALKTFSLPPGYHLELLASEPLVRDPIALEWDTHGRLWVVEMPAFLRDLKLPEPDLEPICRIVVLEDTHHTGHMDKRTVFADGLVLPRVVKVLEHGVLVGEPPNLWLMHDQNGDLHMHSKELVTDTYGRRNNTVEENANGLMWGLDNWMHTTGNETYVRLKHGKFEVAKTLDRGEWGLTQDDAGRIFRNSNESPVHVDFTATPYFARNPNLLRTSGSYAQLGSYAEINTVWPARPNPGTNRAYQAGVDRPDGSILRYTSACSPLIYRGDALPSELYGNYFVTEPAANLITRSILTDEGATIGAHKAYTRGDFVASTDARFRPLYLANAPDGTITIVDMYRGVIQEKSDISQYLYDQIQRRHLVQPTEMGRIYRVVHDSTPARPTAPLADATPAQLVAALASSNGWIRDRAQQTLVERDDRAVTPALIELLRSAPDWRTRLRALSVLEGLDALQPELVSKALTDLAPQVRAAAVRVSEPWLAEGRPEAVAAVLKMTDDSDWLVIRQLAASLGSLPLDKRPAPLAALMTRHGDDTITLDAALSGLRGGEVATLDQLLQADHPDRDRCEPALIMLAATIVRSAQNAAIQDLFKAIAGADESDWRHMALLRGAEVALLKAKMPGPPDPERGLRIDKLAPGGAYYFSQVTAPPPPRRTRNRSRLQLSQEPSALVARSSRSDGPGSRAAAVLARVEWPGKPGAEAPLPPLTAAEQARYEAGSVVYKNICQACHQPDGHGQAHLAADLIDSELALAPPEVTARILLNGKEGSIGLMPPIGMSLSDDQIASVLTYIRREWGQPGTPVDPATVKEVRAQTAGRTHPWTNPELLALPAMKQ
jgi:mono/diheme cytochrome c family protein